MYLPDVNVWIALAFEAHSLHPAAKVWFDGIGDESCTFCRLTQQGFLRLATNPKAIGEDVLTLNEAWALYDSIVGDPRIRLEPEPVGIEATWRTFTQGDTFSTKVWSDAYLAAFAKTSGLRLVTCDKGFHRYSGLDWVLVKE